ncbi:hypothetical protein, conserved [Eimeria maxima]|uniref:ATPTG10-like domain-containing protein n=1 Tax=Eimeria maxima TaxID=5804 RepID=U6M3E2_EIMMA|nr:hypothetical protein, conserved [Eimeria maxima]CDJ56964.1 hypothetical protein, conserved [Eimeria maxima]
MEGGEGPAQGSGLGGPPGPPPAEGSGAVLLKEAEQLAAYIEGGNHSGEKGKLLQMSWGDKAVVLPALRRLLLSPNKERETIKRAIDALLPPSDTPVSQQDPHFLAGKLWLQARLFAMHEKSPLQF